MKKFVSVIAAVTVLAAFTVDCLAAEISAKSAILMDAVTGEVLYEKNPHEKKKIASTTKIMTALVVIENCDLGDTVKIDRSCAGVEGSSLYLKEGETVSVETLLYGLMLRSGNDAAAALACHTAGDIQKFAEMMNKRAAELGCTDTNFVNPHGLDADGHYSTAYDMALIAAEAMKNEVFRKIVSTTDISIEGRKFSNHNKLLKSLDGCIGVKTGYTKSSGRSLVTCVEKNGMSLICVTLDAPSDWTDHESLYSECLAKWQGTGYAVRGYSVPVVSGEDKSVCAMPRERFNELVAADAEIEVNTEIKKFVYAPVKSGDVLGKISVMIDGEEVFSTDLTAEENIAADSKQKLTVRNKVGRVISNALDSGFGKLGYEPER